MLYFYFAEGNLAEACMHFTTRGLIAGVSSESFQALTDFMRLYVLHTDNFHVCDNHMHVVWSHMVAT